MATPVDQKVTVASIFDFFAFPRELRDAIFDQKTLSSPWCLSLGRGVIFRTRTLLNNLLLVNRRFKNLDSFRRDIVEESESVRQDGSEEDENAEEDESENEVVGVEDDW